MEGRSVFDKRNVREQEETSLTLGNDKGEERKEAMRAHTERARRLAGPCVSYRLKLAR
jgi:hypothetical protein